MILYNKTQTKCIEHPPAPLMIIAGAGTGKTSTLLHRIRHLIVSNSIKANHVLLLTFTDKATAEAKQTILEILGDKANSIFIGTFHSFCHSIIRRYGPKSRVNDVLWQESDILFYLINHFNDMDFIQSRVFSENPVKAIRESFIPFFGRVSDELLSPKELESKLKDIENSQDWFLNNFPGIHPRNTQFNDVGYQLQDLVNAFTFFQKANLAQANLTGANLSGADLTGTNLEYANLDKAFLVKAKLTKANLNEASLRGAILTSANLMRANLAGANLSSENLFVTFLRKANLHSADLSGANLYKADFRFSTLTNVYFCETKMPDGKINNTNCS